jgi:hypothetical protein
LRGEAEAGLEKRRVAGFREENCVAEADFEEGYHRSADF